MFPFETRLTAEESHALITFIETGKKTDSFNSAYDILQLNYKAGYDNEYGIQDALDKGETLTG